MKEIFKLPRVSSLENMNKTNLKTDFHGMLGPFSSVLSAYLFGSVAAGLDREDSDPEIVVGILKKNMDDFKCFAREILRSVDSADQPPDG